MHPTGLHGQDGSVSRQIPARVGSHHRCPNRNDGEAPRHCTPPIGGVSPRSGRQPRGALPRQRSCLPRASLRGPQPFQAPMALVPADLAFGEGGRRKVMSEVTRHGPLPCQWHVVSDSLDTVACFHNPSLTESQTWLCGEGDQPASSPCRTSTMRWMRSARTGIAILKQAHSHGTGGPLRVTRENLVVPLSL
jgi:hypothetical protein